MEVGETLDYVWLIQVDQFGWAAPPPDGQIGGNALYDVYLKDTLWDGTFGYVESSMEQHGHSGGGDNPHTPVVEAALLPPSWFWTTTIQIWKMWKWKGIFRWI